MNLTKEEISAIADRLDEAIGNAFHDSVWSVLSERDYIDHSDELSDEDVQKIKDELKLTL